MAKMNRRDYLIGMGATAGAMASASVLDIFAKRQQQSRSRRPTAQSKIFIESGPRRFDLLSTESVKLVFTGLMAIYRNQAGECVVGFHSMASQYHRHELTINIFRKQGASCPAPEVIPVAAHTPLSLTVTQPDLLNGVYFFQPPFLADGTKHDNDFRLIPNLEGPEWYEQELSLKQGVYNPTLTVPHGLFYALRATGSTFRRQKPEGDSVLEVGRLADYVGTNIYLKPGGRVELNIGPTVKVLEQAVNVKHEIHFVNHCMEKNSPNHCEDKFKPYHLTDKTQRNDFYMNFEALEGLPPESEYHLIIEKRGTPKAIGVCGEVRATDEAPCSAVGFGGKDGSQFPTFP